MVDQVQEAIEQSSSGRKRIKIFFQLIKVKDGVPEAMFGVLISFP